MKCSPYNFFVKALISKDYLGYNSFYNSLVEFTPEDYKTAVSILNNPADVQLSKRYSKIRKILVQGGFLVKNNINFLKILKKRYNASKGSNTLSLTIAPTLKCNFRCKYCFEEPKNATMSQICQDHLLSFIQNNLKEDGKLYVTWFGGEPLLALNIINYLSTHMKKICEEKKGKYFSDLIISNGHLLSPKIARQLKNNSINSVQITLDGPEKIHDNRRPLKNGGKTFNTILKNIERCHNIIKIIIRVNIDKENVNALNQVKSSLDEKNLNNVAIYPGHVFAYTTACQNIANFCLSSDEFLDIKWNFELDQLSENRFIPNFPELTGRFCIASNPNGYVITPSGYVFKCWNQVSMNEQDAVMHVKRKPTTNMKNNLKKWEIWDPFNDQDCINCAYLPLCMGGCPYKAMILKTKHCTHLKNILEEVIVIHHAIGRLCDVKAATDKFQLMIN
jgi:uncharacterized protein